MNLSPAWEVELSLLPASTVIDDRGEIVVVSSRQFPDHIWKNFILVDSTPRRECYDDLARMYALEFPARDFSIAFGWNNPAESEPCIADLRRNGFVIARDLVLSAEPTAFADVPRDAIALRECRAEADWVLVVQRRIEFLCEEPFKDLKTSFELDKFRTYRDLVGAGRGHWFIASSNGEDIADVGVFYSGSNWASIDELLVYPAVRRRGWGVATVLAACHAAQSVRPPVRFITIAGDDNLARRLLASHQFREEDRIQRAHRHKFMG